MNKNFFNIFLILSFGIFGLTALIYQVSFAKNLVLLFGLTAPAIATVLAVYFSGLALGSFIFGKFADRLIQNFKHYLLYISLFAAVGIYGFSVPFLFQILGKTIQWINQIYPLDFSGFNFFAFLLSFLFLIIPAILIGGGFPVISKILVRESETLGKKISLLYFINTFGSVIGALLAGFWLIPAIGVKMTFFSASGLNLAIGALLITCLNWRIKQPAARQNENISVNQRSYQRESASILKNHLFIYILFLTGFLALALEVFYTKTLILYLGSSTYAFSLVLIVFLLGIALGSLIISPYLDRLKRGFFLFGLFSGLLGSWLFITLKIFEKFPFFYLKILEGFSKSPQFFEEPNFGAIIFSQSSILFLIIFPATLLMGMIFPLLIKLANPDSKKIGEGVGKLYFSNTLGGVFGSFFAGFFILPNLGFQKSLVLILSIYFILAVLFLMREKGIGNFSRNVLTSLFLGLLIFSIFSSPWSEKVLIMGVSAHAPRYLGESEEEIRQKLEKKEILFYKEGLSQVAVMKTDSILSLIINGKIDASTGLDLETEILTGALPLILHPNPKEILNIGLGSGITLGAINQFDLPEKIEAVEIDPKVIEASQYFKDYTHNALADPRVKMISADARNYLYLTDKKYDVISSGPSNPWVSGNSYLFTKEYYQLVKNHLKKDGLMLQWIQYYSFWPEDLKTVLRTFSEVFPQIFVFESFLSSDLLLVGSESEKPILDFNLIVKKFEDKKIQEELQRAFVNNPYALLSRLIGESVSLKEVLESSKIHTDDRPFLEFSAPKALYQKTALSNLEILLKMREKMKKNLEILKGAEIEEISKYFSFRENWILAEIAFSKGDTEEAIAFYEKAQKTGLSHPWLDLSMQEALKYRK